MLKLTIQSSFVEEGLDVCVCMCDGKREIEKVYMSEQIETNIPPSLCIDMYMCVCLNDVPYINVYDRIYIQD